jgi:hypothetical protein
LIELAPSIDLAHTYVAISIRCRVCGYDLYGLGATSKCPECGTDVWTTVERELDPHATRLPQLRNPKAVGDGLLWMVGCMFAAVSLVGVHQAGQWLEGFEPVRWRWWGMEHLLLYAGVMALLSIVGVLRLKPPQGKEPLTGPVWRDLRLLCVGILGWAALDGALAAGCLHGKGALVHLMVRIAMALMAATALLGLRGVLQIIGERSREYRTSRSGRQSATAMIAAVGGSVAGHVMRYVGETSSLRSSESQLAHLGTIVVWTCNLLLLIGLAYLLVNAWWIRSALRRPPRSLDGLLLPGEPLVHD